MSIATYTDGSYTIYGSCTCNKTRCECGSVIHFPSGERLTNARYGQKELNDQLREMAKNAPTIEEIWEITKRIPSDVWHGKEEDN